MTTGGKDERNIVPTRNPNGHHNTEPKTDTTTRNPERTPQR